LRTATEPSPERIDLEAARDAKLREIRDAELDRQTGKLSDQDYEAIDSTLRAEAVELLRCLDALDAAQLAEQEGPDADAGATTAEADDRTPAPVA
ncbi:MAG: hypothetical protein ACRDKL_09335, partial [Solirubrobacteraceae bacterium]